MIGFVKGLDRGEDDEVGRVTLRVLDNDKARNVTMELNDTEYHIAGEADAGWLRQLVSCIASRDGLYDSRQSMTSIF